MRPRDTHPKSSDDDKTQRQKFKDAARELGCSEDEEAFDKALKKMTEAHAPKSDKGRKEKKNAK